MSVEKVKAFFKPYGMEQRIREFEVSCATAELAAKALNCETARIAKTLSFKTGEQSVLILVAGDAKIDNAKYKKVFGKRPKMLTPEEVIAKIGYEVGGVCPFGINPGVDVYLDESLRRFPAVFPSCGSSNSLMELSLEELEKFTNAKGWVDVSSV